MPANPHILESSGAPQEADGKFDIYCTNYEFSHGRPGFKTRSPPKQHATGYLANFRPGVYYRPELDERDNPALGNIIAEAASRSQTRRHYRSYTVGDSGWAALPALPLPEGTRNESGYGVQGGPSTLPTDREVRRNYALQCVPGGHTIPERAGDLLKTQRISKDPVQSENYQHGPEFMSTESTSRYLGQPTGGVNTFQKSVGVKTKSGWTCAQSGREPVTYRPDEPFSVATSRKQTKVRPVGLTTVTVDYSRPPQSKGTEDLPGMHLAGNVLHDTGYTRGADTRSNLQHRRTRSAYEPIETLPELVSSRMKKSDPAAYMNSQFPDNGSSVTRNCFEDQPYLAKSSCPPVTVAATIGAPEMTGSVENNKKYTVRPAEHPSFYDTQYSQRFYDPAPFGEARQGFIGGKTNTQLTNGFSKSTLVHEHGAERDTLQQLASCHPYVARSLMRRDPYFHDDPHAHKLKV